MKISPRTINGLIARLRLLAAERANELAVLLEQIQELEELASGQLETPKVEAYVVRHIPQLERDCWPAGPVYN